MQSYTVREAAEICGISYQAMRTRVDRGQLQVIKRDGTRRITEGELETAGLLGGSSDPEIVRLRSENAELRQKLRAKCEPCPLASRRSGRCAIGWSRRFTRRAPRGKQQLKGPRRYKPSWRR